MAKAARSTIADGVRSAAEPTTLLDYDCVTHLAEVTGDSAADVERFRRDVIGHSAFVVALPNGQFGLSLAGEDPPLLSEVPYRLLRLVSDPVQPSAEPAPEPVDHLRTRSLDARVSLLEENLADLVRTHADRTETQLARIAEFWGSMESVITHLHGVIGRIDAAAAEAAKPRPVAAPPLVPPRIETILSTQAEALQSSLFPVIKGLSRVEKALAQVAPLPSQDMGGAAAPTDDLRVLLEGIEARLAGLEHAVKSALVPEPAPAQDCAEARMLMAEVLADYRQRMRTH